MFLKDTISLFAGGKKRAHRKIPNREVMKLALTAYMYTKISFSKRVSLQLFC